MSALDGDMVVDRGDQPRWYDGPTLLQMLETAELPQRARVDRLRLPVQYVARPDARHAARLPGPRRGGLDRGRRRGDRCCRPDARRGCARFARTTARSDARRLHDAGDASTLEDDARRVARRPDRPCRRTRLPRRARGRRRRCAGSASAALDRAPHVRCCGIRRARCARASTAHRSIAGTSRRRTREPAPATLAMNDIGRVASHAGAAGVRRPLRTTIARPAASSSIDEATNDTVAAGMIR